MSCICHAELAKEVRWAVHEVTNYLVHKAHLAYLRKGAALAKHDEKAIKPMRLLVFHQRRFSVHLERYTRRWWLRSDRHLNPSCLADYVRMKRLRENLTMKELAGRLGVSHGALKYWEMHKSQLSGRNRNVLVAYLGFDPEAQRGDPNVRVRKKRLLGIL